MEGFAHPLTLRFYDRVLEQAYQSYRLRGFFRALDTHYLTGQTLLSVGFCLLQPYLFPSIAFTWANVFHPVICLTNCLAIQLIPWPVYERHRHVMQLLARAVVDWNAVCGLPYWSPPAAVRSVGIFTTHMLLTSGVGFLNWASIGWPLLLQYHLSYNLIAACIYAHTLGPHVCFVVLQNERGAALMMALWNVVRRTATLSGHLRRLLLCTVGPLPPAAASCSTPREPNPNPSAVSWRFAPAPAAPATAAASFLDSLTDDAMCWASVSFVQLLLGFVLPTCLLYVLERSSREHFLRKGYRTHIKEVSPGQCSGSNNGDCSDNSIGEGAGNGSAGRRDVGAAGDGDGDGVGTSTGASTSATTTSMHLRRRRRRQLTPRLLEDISSLSKPSPLPLLLSAATAPASQLELGWGQGRGPVAVSHPTDREPVESPLRLSQQTLQQLRLYRLRGEYSSGSCDLWKLLQRVVVLLLASMLVLLLWELQLYMRFLGPTLLQGQGRQIEGRTPLAGA